MPPRPGFHLRWWCPIRPL